MNPSDSLSFVAGSFLQMAQNLLAEVCCVIFWVMMRFLGILFYLFVIGTSSSGPQKGLLLNEQRGFSELFLVCR